MRNRSKLNPRAFAKEPMWYKDAVIYELHVRSFFDSNADGIGDFRGVTEKLDYLAELGVTAIWLLPFYPSPLKDDGYDIADYYSINPIYGTLGDFKVFLREAHRRGMRVITELVLNHTSDQHGWFQRARRAKPGSPQRDFYVWTNDPSKYKEVRIIFKDFEPSNWSWDPIANSYYWHRFYAHQPDLNFDNPAVHKEIAKVLDFWCDLGVDGFRLDAIPYLYEREGTSGESLPETHQYLKELRRHVDEKYGDRMFLAEANQWPEEAVTYFGSGKGDECHMAFHFPLMPRLFMAVRMEDRIPIVDIIEQTPPLPETSQWALFLRNHDELTLEMVTDEERDYMYRVYATETKARINLGIRRRLGPLLGNDRNKVELLNLLLFSLPGTPVVYYGDEIGMGDNIYLGDRNGVRTPMHWSSDKNAGFSRASPQALPLPIIVDPEYHYESTNVEAQQRNQNSLLWWMKRLITLRKRSKAFGRGTVEFLHPDNRKILAFIRRYENEVILVVANLSRFAQPVELDLKEFKDRVPVEVFGRTKFPAISSNEYFLTLSPHAAHWFSLELQPKASKQAAQVAPSLPKFVVNTDWDEVLFGQLKRQLEAELPHHISSRPWFFGEANQISGVKVQDLVTVRINSEKAVILMLDVQYIQADGESYLLPVAFAAAEDAERLKREQPEFIVAEVEVAAKRETGVLYDAAANPEFTKTLVQLLLRRRSIKNHGGELIVTSSAALRDIGVPRELAQPRLSSVHQRNTAAICHDQFFFKLFRRVERGTNPQLEVERCLTEKKFQHIPRVAGALEYRWNDGDTFTVAIASEMIRNARNGWAFTLDALGRYFERVRSLDPESTDVSSANVPLLALARTPVPAEVSKIVGTYIEAARLLGQRTAELHVALSSDPDRLDFAPEPFTPFYQRSIYQSMRNRIVETLDLLSKRIGTLPESVQPAAAKLLKSKDELVRRMRGLFEQPLNGMRIRCHGNFHLGEIIYTGKDFVIIDFEDDPRRSIGERRIKRSAMHDATRMVRSFDYAAHVGVLQQVERCNVSSEEATRFAPWKKFWQRWVSAVFLRSYMDGIAETELLPKPHEQLVVLTYSNLLDKAFYELNNELQTRPERAVVPIEAVLDLLELWKRDEKPVLSTTPRSGEPARYPVLLH
jgi:maltose alpha-D-glucosyltransferase/alpha-amylase